MPWTTHGKSKAVPEEQPDGLNSAPLELPEQLGRDSLAPPNRKTMTKNHSTSSTSTQNSSSSSLLPIASTTKLRVQVLSAHSLVGKDRNGKSDPFIVVSLPGAPPPPSGMKKDFYRRVTSVQPKTLEPTWKESEATFEWDITSDWYQKQATREESFENAVEEQDQIKRTASSKRAEDDAFLKTPTTDNNTQLTESPTINTEDVREAEAGKPPIKPAPPLTTRTSHVGKLSAATTKILAAPVRMTTKGAVATTRAVRRRTAPRPIRLRKGASSHKQASGTVDYNSIQHHRGNVGAIEFVVWDKDKWSGNDYMGECSLRVDSWIAEGKSATWDQSQPTKIALVSSRRNAKVSGEIIVRVGLVANTAREADEVYNDLLLASRSIEGAGIRSVPADESVGTTGPSEAFVDDGLSSGSESEAMEEMIGDGQVSDSESEEDYEETTTEVEEMYESDQSASGKLGIPIIPVITPTSDADKEMEDEGDNMATVKAKSRRNLLPKSLRRSSYLSNNNSTTASANASDAGEESSSQSKKKLVRVRVKRKSQNQQQQGQSDSQDALPAKRSGRKRKTKQGKQNRGKGKRDFAFKSELGMDIIGIVQMEVKGAQDLPRWKNSLGTGFDMDAFVIVSFGQRVFRTRVARHSLNPVWDEKLLFHVRQHESNFVTKLAIYDWDKLSANDFVGSTEIKVAELIEAAPKPDPSTSLYNASDDGKHEMKTFKLALARPEEDSKSIGKHHPVLTIEAKYTPYSSLRQRFWRQLLTQYDTNDSGTVSNLELTSMLDSLGSTLTGKTIEGLFSQFGKKNLESDELTIDEAIIALEREITKPWSEKRYVERGWDASPSGSGAQTPLHGDFFNNDAMDYSGPHAPSYEEEPLMDKNGLVVPSTAIEGVPEGSNEKSIKPVPGEVQRDMSALSLAAPVRQQTNNSNTSSTGNNADEDEQVERVIVLKSCPLCHLPRLSKKAEVDIVTHLAVCASQDWRRVDSMVVSNFVTASQAHRKWYTKVITKISQGQYRLGANSANIIVQDRLTGELLEEKMQVYVRLGIRLLYKGARSQMEGARIKRMLKNMSVKQGKRYDSPLSAREIPQFIAFHNLKLDEIQDPIESFKTFNQFFYRKLKPEARPVSEPDNPSILVSSADCRLMAFSSITEATKVWIKGREFTVQHLLGDGYKGNPMLDKFQSGGSLVIFRLAPQDYHRFHCPADGVVEKITHITGQYYTVNPMAIRSGIDVYGENVRAVVEFKSKEFGTFFCVCIGAMMVGSINLTVKEGDQVKRGAEFGYYAFGGSTNVCIFEQGRVELDDDLLTNSRHATETLVRVGMRIGKAVH